GARAGRARAPRGRRWPRGTGRSAGRRSDGRPRATRTRGRPACSIATRPRAAHAAARLRRPRRGARPIRTAAPAPLRARGLQRPIAVLAHPSDLPRCPPGALAVCEPAGLPPDLARLAFGNVDARAGAAAVRCIEAAVEWTLAGSARAIVTAPIHKEAFAAA